MKLSDLEISDQPEHEDFAFLGKYLFFGARPGYGKPHGLYRTDGTSANVEFVCSVATDTSWRVKQNMDFITSIFSAGNKIFFVATDDEHGAELWVKDTLQSEPFMPKEINPGKNDFSYFESQVTFNNSLYFTHDPDPMGLRKSSKNKGLVIWKSDGTAEGTSIIGKPKSKFPFLNNLTATKNYVFFFRKKNNNLELWLTRGSKKSTNKVASLEGFRLTNQDSYQGNSNYVLSENIMCFNVKDTSGKRFLYTTDGTAKGTHVVADVDLSHSSRSATAIVSKHLYYVVDKSAPSYSELWETDGTAAGTKKVFETDTLINISSIVAAEKQLFIFTKKEGIS